LPGHPLDITTRAFMQRRLGHDFSRVRVHTDLRAAEAADSVGALAWTVGGDIAFGAGQYAPQTPSGLRLLAHELVHVVQQGGAAHAAPANLEIGPPEDAAERDADRLADTLVRRADRLATPAAPVRLALQRPCLQRTAKFVAGSVTESINPAEQIAENTIPDRELFLGDTKFTLNGTTFLDATTGRQALHRPDVTSAKRADRGVDCLFTSVPDNVGSYDMRLLKRGSTWTHVTEKKNVGGRLPSLRSCKEGFGDVTFVVRGGRDLGTKVETHEKRHAADYEAIFNSVLVPWDTKVTEAHKKSTKMAGPDDATCESRLYLAAVGPKQTPGDLAATITNEINSRASAFHSSAAGRKPNVSVIDVDTDCTVVKAKVE
jgi:hypothetical protein